MRTKPFTYLPNNDGKMGFKPSKKKSKNKACTYERLKTFQYYFDNKYDLLLTAIVQQACEDIKKRELENPANKRYYEQNRRDAFIFFLKNPYELNEQTINKIMYYTDNIKEFERIKTEWNTTRNFTL